MSHSSLDHLPTVVFAMVPELLAIGLPQETRATCHSCPVSAPDGEQDAERPFQIALKCCTYHPRHPNYLIGRALRREDEGAENIRKRLMFSDGVSAEGIDPSEAWSTVYDRESGASFGRKARFACPYLGTGDLSCTVWRDRGAVCRTWHCRYVDGARGFELWNATRLVMRSMERWVAQWCIKKGDPPAPDKYTDPWAMADWYIRTAELVDEMTVVEAAALRDKVMDERVKNLLGKAAKHMPPVPDVLGPSVAGMDRFSDGTVRLRTFTFLDHIRLPTTIWELMSRLDGKTRWQDALAATNAVVDEPFDAGMVELLFRMGLLEERDPNDAGPEPGTATITLYVPADNEPD